MQRTQVTSTNISSIGYDPQSATLEVEFTSSFVLWSGDSDFASPVTRIKNAGKKAILFAVSGKVSPELDETEVFIFDVKKIKEFVCFPKEIPQSIKDKIGPIKSQRDSLRSP